MPKLSEIPVYVSSRYQVDIGWSFIEQFIASEERDNGLELNPDFQRGYVWTQDQKERYIEHVLQRGVSGLDIYFNSPSYTWEKQPHCDYSQMVCVDGLQRITAVREFLDNKVKAFGYYRNEYSDGDSMHSIHYRFHVHINDFQTRKEVLKWYLQLNAGGTAHTKEELNRVRSLLEECS